MKVTKETYFETAYIHAREFTDEAANALEQVAGIKLDNVGKSAIFGAMVKACAFEGLITLRKLHEHAFDVSELLPLTVDDLEKWVLGNKLGHIQKKP